MSITEPGKYLARCIDNPSQIRWGRAKSGAEQIALSFAFLENGKPGSSTIEWVGGFGSDQAAEITIKALRACGWSGDDLLDLSGINDCDVELDIAWDEYQGERRLRIKWVNRPGSGRLTFRDALDERSKKALAARMRGMIARANGGAPSGAQRKPADDYPF